jgi:hypothetical protein
VIVDLLHVEKSASKVVVGLERRLEVRNGMWMRKLVRAVSSRLEDKLKSNGGRVNGMMDQVLPVM